MKMCSFPPLEPGMEIDSTLAPPRNQLDHLGNHWNSLHFQCAALMRNSARQRHPGGQSGNLMVIAKSSKTIGCSDISRSRDARSRIQHLEKVFALVRLWFELRAVHAETLQKPLEIIAFPSILAETRSTARNLGIVEECWPKKTAARDLALVVPES